MMQISTVRRYTADQFERMAESEGFELIDGRLHEKATGAETSWIQGHVSAVLSEWAHVRAHGYVFGSDCPYRCFPGHPDTIRKADVSFVRRERIPDGRLPKYSLLIPPDLVVEVIAPAELACDLWAKVGSFLSAGTPLVWILNPGDRSMLVCRDGMIRTTGRDDIFEAGPLLPGFSTTVAALFPKWGIDA